MSADFTSVQRAPWLKWLEGKDPDLLPECKHGMSNGFTSRQRTSTNDDSVIDIHQVDGSNRLLLGAAVFQPARGLAQFFIQPNGQQGSQPFWISDDYYYITGIQETHHVACTTAGPVTGQVFIDRGVSATPGDGTNGGGSAMSTTFNMKATADTTQSATLAASLTRATIANAQQSPPIAALSAIAIRPGDRLSFITSTQTLTSLAGVCLSVFFAPAFRSQTLALVINANNRIATRTIANISQPARVVTGVSVFYKVKGSDAGAVTLDITQDTTTGAPGSGTSILAAPMSLKQTAGTVYNPTLAVATALLLTQGNRLAFLLSGTPTAITGLVIMVYTTPAAVLNPQFSQESNTDLGVSQKWAGPFDRDYIVEDVDCIFDTAAGGALKLAVTIDGPTTAPGAGTVVQTDNSNAGFDLNATANTLQVATMAGYRNRILPAGYTLGMLYSTTKQSLAGLQLSATLRPR